MLSSMTLVRLGRRAHDCLGCSLTLCRLALLGYGDQGPPCYLFCVQSSEQSCDAARVRYPTYIGWEADVDHSSTTIDVGTRAR